MLSLDPTHVYVQNPLSWHCCFCCRGQSACKTNCIQRASVESQGLCVVLHKAGQALCGCICSHEYFLDGTIITSRKLSICCLLSRCRRCIITDGAESGHRALWSVRCLQGCTSLPDGRGPRCHCHQAKHCCRVAAWQHRDLLSLGSPGSCLSRSGHSMCMLHLDATDKARAQSDLLSVINLYAAVNWNGLPFCWAESRCRSTVELTFDKWL